MKDDWYNQWLGESLAYYQKEFNKRLATFEEIQKYAPPRPTPSWYKRKKNRFLIWWSDNVSWRFAKHPPDYWD